MMLKPYYEDGGVTIYHGDYRDIIPGLAFDAVVTDPPYGVGWDVKGGEHRHRSRKRRGTEFVPVHGDTEPFDPSDLIALGLPTVMFGANYFSPALPPSASWIVWDKRPHMASTRQADCELAWTNLGGPARMFRKTWNGGIRPTEDRASHKAWGVLHPTQKPVSLMRWVIERIPPGTICDPFMGSGTTLRAAKDLGRKAIGIEIEERYCEVAARRLGQEVLAI